MSQIRKLERRMAREQMAAEGVQHPCRKTRKQGLVTLGHYASAGKTSWFSAHWREFAARRRATLNKAPKKGKKRVRAV